MTKIAINGFGRIGRNALRVILDRTPDLELVAINDLADNEDLFYLTKYDTILGTFPGELELADDGLVVNGRTVKMFAEPDPSALPWGELGVEIVIDCTGIFTSGEKAKAHLDAGAKKVVISAPGKDVDGTFVMGVNEDKYDPQTMHIVSNASCTTNCLAPMVKVLNDEFGIVDGIMTTIHAYTGDQNLHDNVHKKDRRRARAAAQNMVPTSTGAAKAIGAVIPELEGKLDGFAMRVPTITGSATDLTVELTRHVDVDEVNAAFKKAAESEKMKGRLVYSEDPIVSSDIVTTEAACTFDAPLTKSIGQTVKIIGWYDNEYGYTCQLLDLTSHIAATL
ncbi:NAD-dependent glyceraldehyde-3-phosphate dehydrogenase [Micrococcus lylae]|uniref:Glyceraldehyde-3-phosphate dehydrogenase n=1 Tax=Micrococcus lylae TaxID=1273 RepID=A0A1R4JGV2_9MICC|nr:MULTISPECIES: type I glyceraldehyde-3-phosphate dehydrogenase [Micrococcus]MCT2007284.1 type I glyceraldehyde-3-phosphate dehydrogenase [Micrococcus lylae]MCT2070956.1 type I glyceraldehyde-3-phosphate dehydrogenase [Micrococcus lylae]OFR86342.1 type I glyceraldehyde-3-phosphate dehydrogenase [Micrococcus sp. HMSC067E09]PNL17979.1 type I glyceraldehyde-3-phosphate dehydrogenase [Micrococcus sp. FDAARGOS_333]TFI00828.1 type I glyceraldehyde-3-phosphate dehydrogenase [Micrococcus lylae]